MYRHTYANNNNQRKRDYQLESGERHEKGLKEDDSEDMQGVKGMEENDVILFQLKAYF